MNLYLDFYAELEDFLAEKSNVQNILTDLPIAVQGQRKIYKDIYGDEHKTETGFISIKAELFIKRYHITRKISLPDWFGKIVTRNEANDPNLMKYGASTYKPIEWGTLVPEERVMNEKEQAEEEHKQAQGKPAEREYSA